MKCTLTTSTGTGRQQPGAATQIHLINSSSASVTTSIKADALVACWTGADQKKEMPRRKDISNDLRE